MEEFWRHAQAAGLELAARLTVAALALLGSWLALRFLSIPVRRGLERGLVDPSTASFVLGTLRTVVLFAAGLMVLQALGVQVTSLVALLGAAGVAVALALQSSLGNFASGLLILSDHSVRVGDVIEISGVQGKVIDLRPFQVVLETADNQRVTVPNNLLTTSIVKNLSALPTRRCQWTLPLPASADLGAAREPLLARLRADPRVLAEPAPQVTVQEWAADRRVLSITAWSATANQPAVQAELLEALGTVLESRDSA